jgi:hypothetical protein
LITVTTDAVDNFAPVAAATDAAYSVGMKNWYGTLIHSMSVSMNGSVIIQQQGLQSILNSFKLMTSLSWGDVERSGSTIGFYPDTASSVLLCPAIGGLHGNGACNNMNWGEPDKFGVRNSYTSLAGNAGLRKRQAYINFDPLGGLVGTYGDFITLDTCNQIYKSHIIQKIDAAVGATQGVYQIAVSATIYLRHLHDFWAKIPLMKSAYYTITLQLNNCSTVMNKSGVGGGRLTVASVNSSVGGINPLMVSSMSANCGGRAFNAAAAQATVITASVAVGSRVLEPSQIGVAGVTSGAIGNSITLNVPAYSMHSTYEMAYLAQGVRAVPYTDFYQMTVASQAAGTTVNALLSNGIAGLRKIYIFPNASPQDLNTLLPAGMQTYHSPFDTALTSGNSGAPFAHIGQFNIQVAGCNTLTQMHRYGYEHFIQEFGASGVNFGLLDGVTSGLISQHDWSMAPVYVCDLSRMPAVERSIPKSVQLQGMNLSRLDIDYICFIEYDQVGLKLDLLSGARV